MTFNDDGLSAEACKNLADLLLEGHPTLDFRKLHFFNNMSGPGGAQAIARIVSASHHLEDFRLSSTRCTAEGGVPLVSALSECAMLSRLDLGDNTLGYDGAQKIAKSLPSWPRMKELLLGDLGLTHEGILEILSSLENCACADHLSVLDLSYNDFCVSESEISSVEARALSVALSRMTSLDILILRGNELGKVGATAILTALAKGALQALTGLEVEECEIRGKDAVRICKALCTVPKRGGLRFDDNFISQSHRSAMRQVLEQKFNDDESLGAMDGNVTESESENDESSEGKRSNMKKRSNKKWWRRKKKKKKKKNKKKLEKRRRKMNRKRQKQKRRKRKLRRGSAQS